MSVGGGRVEIEFGIETLMMSVGRERDLEVRALERVMSPTFLARRHHSASAWRGRLVVGHLLCRTVSSVRRAEDGMKRPLQTTRWRPANLADRTKIWKMNGSMSP